MRGPNRRGKWRREARTSVEKRDEEDENCRGEGGWGRGGGGGEGRWVRIAGVEGWREGGFKPQSRVSLVVHAKHCFSTPCSGPPFACFIRLSVSASSALHRFPTPTASMSRASCVVSRIGCHSCHECNVSCVMARVVRCVCCVACRVPLVVYAKHCCPHLVRG